MTEEQTMPQTEYERRDMSVFRKAVIASVTVSALSLGYNIFEAFQIKYAPNAQIKYDETRGDLAKLTEIKERLKTDSIDEAVSDLKQESSQLESNPERVEYQTKVENRNSHSWLSIGAMVLALSGIAGIGLKAHRKLKRQYERA